MWHSKRVVRIILLPCVISMIGATLLTILIMSLLTKPVSQIVALDILSITDSFIEQQAQSNEPQNVLRQRVEAFSQKLDSVLNTMAKKKQLIIMPKQAIIAGAKDITVEVREQLLLMPLTKEENKRD